MTDRMSSRTEGYHVFIEPKGEAAEILSQVVHDLSGEYGGPLFVPHLTLLAKIPETSEEELVQKACALAASLKPFTLTLQGFGAEETYFRALYMTVQNRDEVARYHAIARSIIGGEDIGEYIPHISLLYGLYDNERKQQTISSLAALSPLSFDVNSLTLWHTPGEADMWRKVGEYSFNAL